MESKTNTECKSTNNNSVELFRTYLHDIRNMKTLDREMIRNIRNMSNDDKMDIILAMNDVINGLKAFLE